MHTLLHITDDAKHYNLNLEENCFDFENTLGKITRLIRRANRPLAQVSKRFSEQSQLNSRNFFSKNQTFIENKNLLTLQGRIISNKLPNDKYVFLKNQRTENNKN